SEIANVHPLASRIVPSGEDTSGDGGRATAAAMGSCGFSTLGRHGTYTISTRHLPSTEASYAWPLPGGPEQKRGSLYRCQRRTITSRRAEQPGLGAHHLARHLDHGHGPP